MTGFTISRLFLSKQGLQPVQVQGDGNCCFHAISVASTSNQTYHLQLQQNIAAFESNEQLVMNGLHVTKTVLNLLIILKVFPRTVFGGQM